MKERGVDKKWVELYHISASQSNKCLSIFAWKLCFSSSSISIRLTPLIFSVVNNVDPQISDKLPFSAIPCGFQRYFLRGFHEWCHRSRTPRMKLRTTDTKNFRWGRIQIYHNELGVGHGCNSRNRSCVFTALVTVNNQFPGLKLAWAEYLGFWDFKNINFIKIVLGLCQENGIKDS